MKEYSFKFPGVVDLQSIPKFMKNCLGLKIPALFTYMNREYSENNVKTGLKTKH